MTKIYMFPGQGSQKKGMGEELFDRFPELVATADEILGYSIKDLCLEDADENLGNTAYTQPALYVVNALTYLAKVEDEGVKPDFVIGHSLGEYSALFAAGAFDFADGLKLVQKRGALMALATGGGMAAVLGMDGDAVRKALADISVDTIDVANLNSPKQTVISGLKADIDEHAPKLQDAGAMRVVVLPVSGAFHSRYMAGAADEFAKLLDEVAFKPLEIPCIANCSAQPYTDDTVAENLKSQIVSSVQWVDTITLLKKESEPEFTEVGPGRVLAGLLRQMR
jgi:trans-AT polyketide synthase/acyltransferase/oxidoreductase domain-containing protein